MKKYIITSAMALAAIVSVSAEEARTQGTQPVRMMKTMTAMMRVASGTPEQMPMKEMAPPITTGDAAIDAQIKVLQAEMEAKIKVIREEYRLKIKALIGDRKVNSGNDMMNRGSSTMRMGAKGEGRDGMGVRGSSTMMVHHDGRMMNGSGTPENGRPPMMHDGNQIPEGMQVKGETTGAEGNEDVTLQVTVKGFFNKFFGR